VSLHRLRELQEQYVARQADNQKRQIDNVRKFQAAKQFEADWYAIYPTSGHVRESDLVPIGNRLLSIVPGLRERFWDFRIAERLSRPLAEPAHEVNVTLLGFACAGQSEKLREALPGVLRMLPDVAKTHENFYGFLCEDDANGLPTTPPFTLNELAKLIDVSRHKLRGDIKAGRWVSPDVKKYLRFRTWRHADPAVQSAVLEKIREYFPEKMWSKLT
jgi:hypothetical protein